MVTESTAAVNINFDSVVATDFDSAFSANFESSIDLAVCS